MSNFVKFCGLSFKLSLWGQYKRTFHKSGYVSFVLNQYDLGLDGLKNICWEYNFGGSCAISGLDYWEHCNVRCFLEHRGKWTNYWGN